MKTVKLIFSAMVLLSMGLVSCQKDDTDLDNVNAVGVAFTGGSESAIFLAIDEESIDNGSQPNNFSDVDVNDQQAEVGFRRSLSFFQKNIGRTVDLFTGQVGDEGWYAFKNIPNSWISAGPTANGTANYIAAGPGLGGGSDNKEVLLYKIANVTPLRATGLSMLVGQTVFAVVYDGDISTNYSPLNANLMGANLGLVALDVLSVTARQDASSSSLPRVSVRIRDINSFNSSALRLFSNAPVPTSSSEPFDITPTTNPQAVITVAAP